MTDFVKCPAKNRAGIPCKLSAGSGTDHKGYGLCRFHGGASPNGKKQAARLMAAELGAIEQIDPHAALERAVGGANGLVSFLQARLAELDEKARKADGAVSSDEPWLAQYREVLVELARISKYAVDAGVAERHVRAIEQWSGPLAQLLEAVLRDRELALSPEQLKKAPKVVGRHLRALEAPAADRSAA